MDSQIPFAAPCCCHLAVAFLIGGVTRKSLASQASNEILCFDHGCGRIDLAGGRKRCQCTTQR